MMTRQAETGGRAGNSGAAIVWHSVIFGGRSAPTGPLAPVRITAARLGGGRLTGPNPIIKSGQEPDLDQLFAQAGQRPWLRRLWHRQRAHEVAEIIREGMELETHGIGGEGAA